MKRLFLSVISMAMALMAIAADYAEIKDISYVPQGTTDAYRLERCKLDVYSVSYTHLTLPTILLV